MRNSVSKDNKRQGTKVEVEKFADDQEYRLTPQNVNLELIDCPPEEMLGNVNWLVESIREHGLTNRPTITKKSDNHYKIVAGRKRALAFLKLNRTQIPVEVLEFLPDITERRKEQICAMIKLDENLSRDNLATIEECVELAQMKSIYEELYPQAAHGGAPGKSGGGKKGIAKGEKIASFAEHAGRKYRKHQRTIQNKIKIGRVLAPFAAKILTSPIRNSYTNLARLAKIEDQPMIERIVEKICNGEIGSVLEGLQESEDSKKRDGAKIQLIEKTLEKSSIKKSSVDLLITSPISNFKNWLELAQFSTRSLKDGGLLLIESTPNRISEIQTELSKQLNYQWTAAIFKKESSQSPKATPIVLNKWSPLLAFCKGKGHNTSLFDSFISKDASGRDAFIYFLSKVTKEGDFVVDPLCSNPFILEFAEEIGRKAIGIKYP